MIQPVQSAIGKKTESVFQEIKNIWLCSEERFPEYLPVVSEETRMRNLRSIQEKTCLFRNRIRQFPRLLLNRNRWAQKVNKDIHDILHNDDVWGIRQVMSKDKIDLWQEELKEFLRRTRMLFPRMSFEEIGQGIRNYMVYAMIRELCDVSMEFSKAAYGYSMLYPVTDNFLDGSRSVEDKLEYNRFIKDVIEGKGPAPKNFHQQKTKEMLDFIRSEFLPEQNKDLYDLLLMMLDAQNTSLTQQNKQKSLSPDERLNISIYKGGISVLFDRFLVKKKITENDLFSYIGLGFFLQLSDDLQDIQEDGERGHQTIFTFNTDPEYIEGLVNKMLRYIFYVMERLQTVHEPFKEFLLQNCCNLVYASVLMSKGFFSEAYLKRLESFMPIPAPSVEAYLENRLEELDEKEQKRYRKMLDAIIFLK
ncbi:MAG: hypothetical protein GX082_12720 [Clostridiaceae bacterium]|nr:hypothetical protein [Clostridiaceae bacterium]